MSDEGTDKLYKRYFFDGKKKPHILDWSIKVKAYGRKKGWAKRLMTEFDPLIDEEVDQDNNARSFLVEHCEGDAFDAIKHLSENDDSATKMWNALQGTFNRTVTKDPSDLQAIKKELKKCELISDTENPDKLITR